MVVGLEGAELAAGRSVLAAVLRAEVLEVVRSAAACVDPVPDVEPLAGLDVTAAPDAEHRVAAPVRCVRRGPDDPRIPHVQRVAVRLAHELSRATLSGMDATTALIVTVLVWVLSAGLGLLLTFWVVRGAILSALAEDRRRVEDERIMREKAARKAAKRAAA